jgi:hypothetical protein
MGEKRGIEICREELDSFGHKCQANRFCGRRWPDTSVDSIRSKFKVGNLRIDTLRTGYICESFKAKAYLAIRSNCRIGNVLES